MNQAQIRRVKQARRKTMLFISLTPAVPIVTTWVLETGLPAAHELWVRWTFSRELRRITEDLQKSAEA